MPVVIIDLFQVDNGDFAAYGIKDMRDETLSSVKQFVRFTRLNHLKFLECRDSVVGTGRNSTAVYPLCCNEDYTRARGQLGPERISYFVPIIDMRDDHVHVPESLTIYKTESTKFLEHKS